MTEPDTAVHVQRALSGGAESLEWLVGRFTPALLVQAHYRMGAVLRRSVEPEDLVQEVWAIALGKLGDFHAATDHCVPALLKFLSSILLYRINGLLREHIVAAARDPDAMIDPKSHGIVTSTIRRESVSRAMATIESLAEPEREVLVMRVLEQRPASEVARQLGISPSLVYVRQHRALQLLRSRLTNSVFDDLAPTDT